MVDAVRRYSPRVLLAVAAVLFLPTLANNLPVIDNSNVWRWFLVALAACAAGGLTLVTVDVWRTHRGRTQLSSVQAIAIGALVGLAVSATEQVVASFAGLSPARDVTLSMVFTVGSFALFGLVSVRWSQGREREERRRENLLNEAVALFSAQQETAEIARQMQWVLDSEINEALTDARVAISERLVESAQIRSSEQWIAIAESLRDTVANTVRPLSREMWTLPAMGDNRIHLTAILRNIIMRQPFQPFALIVIYLITQFAQVITEIGWGLGLIGLTMGCAFIAAILGGANRLMARYPQHHVKIFIGATLLLQATGLLGFPLRELWGATPYTWGEFLTASISGIVLIILTSGVGSVRNHRDAVARTFQTNIDQELVASITASRQVAQLARESARILHGTVQTRLIACAVSIERAATTRDADAFRAALVEAHQALSEPLYASPTDTCSLHDEVERKVALWSGLCAIELFVDSSSFGLTGPVARDAGRIVEEAISNAVRHGSSTILVVTVTCTPSAVEITVQDNGTGPRGGEPGVGSLMLDLACESWSLTTNHPGALLRAHVRTAEPGRTLT